MKLDVKLFARARQLAGRESVEIHLSSPASVGDLRQALAAQFPEMAFLVPNLQFAVGNDYADDSKMIESNMEVACFPPVSGG